MNVCVMARRHPPPQHYSGTILCSFHPLVHAHATIHAPLRLAPQQYPLPPELGPSNVIGFFPPLNYDALVSSSLLDCHYFFLGFWQWYLSLLCPATTLRELVLTISFVLADAPSPEPTSDHAFQYKSLPRIFSLPFCSLITVRRRRRKDILVFLTKIAIFQQIGRAHV